MQCPNCALYHPARYSTCVSCGAKLVADGDLIQPEKESTASGGTQKSRKIETPDAPRRGGIPIGVGLIIAAFILCLSAGGTFFFLTKPPENERLLQEGQKQLQLGQYAFAVKTLSEAVKVKPNDPKALLSLARAYVGVDQIDKASDCIAQAQQLGAGVVAEPELASELANYYRQHNQYEKAVELLRPLAQGDVKGKKAELADLDAAWGDELIAKGDFRQALRCWEEVKELHDGSRLIEAEGRLSTIYQKIADSMLAKGDDDEALKFFAKLNVTAPSATSYERTSDLYERQGKLELAIDQLRHAIKLGSDNPVLTHKLALLMVKRGKELLDSGDADSGYGYLQQAQTLDPRTKAPPATVRNMHFDVAPGQSVHVTGEVWNPGSDALNSLTLRSELYDTKTARTLWTRDTRVIDEFVPPLPSREGKSFELTATAGFDPATTELRMYLNGALYKTYPLKKHGGASSSSPILTTGTTGGGDAPLTLRPRLAPVQTLADPLPRTTPVTTPAVTPNPVPTDPTMPPVAPNIVPSSGGSAEEKTLKDLD